MLGGWQVEMRVAHAQRLEDSFAEEFVERHARHHFHQVAQHICIESVCEFFSRIVKNGKRSEPVDIFCQGDSFQRSLDGICY